MFETFQLLSKNLFLYQVIQLGLQALDLERDDMLAANDRFGQKEFVDRRSRLPYLPETTAKMSKTMTF